MRAISVKWYDILLGALPILLTLWQALVFAANDVSQNDRQLPGPLESLAAPILAVRYVVPVFLLVIFVFLYFYKVIKDAVPKRALKSYLDMLHETYFPQGPTGGFSPEYRITLFAPTNWLWLWKIFPYPSRAEHLVLFTRSGRFKRSQLSWNVSESDGGQFDGVVGYTFAVEGFADVPGLPDYDGGTGDQKQDYLKRAYISGEKVGKLNVKSRSYKAHVIRNKKGERVGVLVMESREPDGLAQIEQGKLFEMTRTIQRLALS